MPDTSVVAGARSPDKAHDLQDLAKQHDGRLLMIALDLSDPDTVQVAVLFTHRFLSLRAVLHRASGLINSVLCVQAAFKAVQTAHTDGVDFLINNAGVLGTFAQIKDQYVDCSNDHRASSSCNT